MVARVVRLLMAEAIAARIDRAAMALGQGGTVPSRPFPKPLSPLPGLPRGRVFCVQMIGQ